jgi:hypothetical protein
VKYWEIIADNLKKAGWSLGWVSALDSRGRTIWIVDAHRDDGKRFVVRTDEKLTAFLGTGIGDWLVRQINMNLESLQRTSHVLFWFSIGLPVFGALFGAGGGVARYYVDRQVLSRYATVLKRWRIMQKSLGPPLNKAGLACGGCLPCQNDNTFLITEHS